MLENATITMSLKDYEELKSYKKKYLELMNKEIKILINTSVLEMSKDELSNLLTTVNNKLKFNYNI